MSLSVVGCFPAFILYNCSCLMKKNPVAHFPTLWCALNTGISGKIEMFYTNPAHSILQHPAQEPAGCPQPLVWLLDLLPTTPSLPIFLQLDFPQPAKSPHHDCLPFLMNALCDLGLSSTTHFSKTFTSSRAQDILLNWQGQFYLGTPMLCCANHLCLIYLNLDERNVFLGTCFHLSEARGCHSSFLNNAAF